MGKLECTALQIALHLGLTRYKRYWVLNTGFWALGLTRYYKQPNGGVSALTISIALLFKNRKRLVAELYDRPLLQKQ